MKNKLEGINIKLGLTEECINDLEDRKQKSPNQNSKKKKKQENENSLWDL